MLVCDNCGSHIADGAKFCPQCADPVTINDIVDGPQVERKKLMCPKCGTRSLFEVDTRNAEYDSTCPKCDSDFTTRIVQVRAKRSRGNKKYGTREFTVRVVDASGDEELIEFSNNSYEDFELRSKDQAAFTYLGNQLALIENLNVGRNMRLPIRRSGSGNMGCILTTMFLLAVIVLACVAIFMLWRQGNLEMYPWLAPLENILPTPTPTG